MRGEAVTRRLLLEHGRTLRYFRHPFLHVGLELIQRRIEPRVPRIDQSEQRLQDVRMRRGRVKHATKPIEQRPQSGHRARIEQRQLHAHTDHLKQRDQYVFNDILDLVVVARLFDQQR